MSTDIISDIIFYIDKTIESEEVHSLQPTSCTQLGTPSCLSINIILYIDQISRTEEMHSLEHMNSSESNKQLTVLVLGTDNDSKININRYHALQGDTQAHSS